MPSIRRIQIDAYRSIQRMDVDLSPAAGATQPFRHLILTGPSGSGKSSALELIHNAVQAAGGAPFRPAPASVTLSAPLDLDRQLVVYFPAARALRVGDVAGPSKIDWTKTSGTRQASLIAQYIVNRKVEQSFARDDDDQATVTAIDAWFNDLRAHLAHVLEDPGLRLIFDRKSFSVRLRYGDGREVTFNELAQGHSAALSIFFELVLQLQSCSERIGGPPEQLQGIVFIDEIETHLHIRLQELILPFLVEVFPNFQFVVATHSPAVIASIPDAVVYDLGKRTTTASEDLQGVRYGTLMTHHFGITADMDHDSTEKLQRLRELARRTRSAAEHAELADLADLLGERSQTLRLEVWKALHPAPASPSLEAAE